MALAWICNTPPVASIGERIKIARQRAGMTQKQLAAEVGCSLPTIKLYESLDSDTPPHGYGFMPRLEHVLGLNLGTVTPRYLDPDDPPVSRATAVQLARALFLVVSDEEAQRRAAGRLADFDVAGEMDLAPGLPAHDGQGNRRPGDA